jgi:hypothetical protein
LLATSQNFTHTHTSEHNLLLSFGFSLSEHVSKHAFIKNSRITVTYDSQVKPYLSVIHLSSVNGPKPVFQEQAVAALW